MISALVVLVGLSLLIIVHELGHFWAAKYFNILVEEFGLGFPPRLIKKKIGETLYSFNLLPLGGYVKLHGEFRKPENNNHPEPDPRSFIDQKAGKRAVVVIAGCVMNFLAGWLIISAIFWTGSPSIIMIESVAKGGPAEVAGIKAGDLIKWDGGVEDFIEFIKNNRGREINLNLLRDGKVLPIQTRPRIEEVNNEGPLGVVIRGGGIARQGFLSGLANGLLASLAIMSSVLTGLYQIFITPQNIVGPVGIFGMAVNTGQLGLVYVLQLLGLISLNLAVLNILPIPALDGGRLLFIIIEKIRGQSFLPKTEMRANAWGMAILIVLIFLVTLKDVALFFL